MLLAASGLLATMVGAGALYGAAPHQKLRADRTHPALWFWAGCAALLGGLGLLLRWAGPATAVFMALTAVMLVWSVLPILCAWWRARTEDTP